MAYYKSKADKSMTQLSEAYGQIVGEREIVSERTIATYEGGTERPVVQEILGALAGAAATGAASALGGKVVDAVTGNEDQESEKFVVGDVVTIDQVKHGGGSGTIIDISGTKPDHFWVETDEDAEKQIFHVDLLTHAKTYNEVPTDERPYRGDAGRTEL